MKNVKPNLYPDHAASGPLPNPPEAGSENCLPVGSRLADFEITGVIGEGGFGIVYLAIDHSLQRTVAIKEYMPGALAARGADQHITIRSKRHQETFDTGLKSFINEARLLAQFDHPALIKVYRFWEQHNTAYMAMRYYEGQTLKNIVRNNPSLVTEAWLKRMLKPILEALETLYSVQILHRDISPDNIMIQTNGEAVLLDFGAARQIIGDMTQALTVILKPGYAPIEQYADDASMQQGPWTDIYALSAVIYSAIARKSPPTSVARMLKDPYEPLANSACIGFSNAFLAAIDKGLCVKPEDRPQSIDAFRQLLGIDPFSHAPGNGLTDNVNGPGGATASITPGSDPLPAGRETERKPLPSARAKTSARHSRLLLVAGIVLAAGFGGALFIRGNTTATPSASANPVDPNRPAPPQEMSAAGTQKMARLITPQQPPVPDAETGVWEKVKSGTRPDATANFIKEYPSGKYAEPARTGLSEIKGKTAAAAIATGQVKLTIKPWGTILVDGVVQGISPPLKNLSLPEGKHRITIANPNFPEYVTNIEISKNKSSSIQYNFAP